MRRAESWSIDLGYRSGGGARSSTSFSMSPTFSMFRPHRPVPYCGDTEYRNGMPCGPEHDESECLVCDRASVSGLSGPCAKRAVEAVWSAEAIFQSSTPFENMVAPEHDENVLDLNLRHVPDALREFLLSPQTGARLVAKRFLAQASEMRLGAFAAVTPVLSPPASQRVFEVVPLDQGHFGLPYFDHILRGLRRFLPDDVRLLEDDREVYESGALAGLGGVVIVHV